MLSRDHHQLDEDVFAEISIYQVGLFGQLLRRATCLQQEYRALSEQIVRTLPDVPGDVESQGHESVLLVGDNTVAGGIAGQILQGHGYQVTVGAADSLEFKKFPGLDLVVLDVPVLDERRLAWVKQACGSRQWPVVVVTSLPEGEARSRLRTEGVAAFVEKPVVPGELACCVRKALDNTMRSPRTS